MSKQTAVDWLYRTHFFKNGELTQSDFEQAKAMEREQIITAFCEGYDHDGDNYDKAEIKYYNETYNGGEQ